MSDHFRVDPGTGEVKCDCTEFHCHYAPGGRKRCPESICDCFIATHPDSPFDLHPEDFIVRWPDV